MTTAIEYLLGNLAPSLETSKELGALRKALEVPGQPPVMVMQTGEAAAASRDVNAKSPFPLPIILWELTHTIRTRFYPPPGAIARPQQESVSVSLDGIGPITMQWFELACCAEKWFQAHALANNISGYLESDGRLGNILEQYDKPPDEAASAKGSSYVSCILVVGITPEKLW